MAKVMLLEPLVIRDKREVRGRLDCEVPLGLMSLAAILEKKGHDVKILDCFFQGYSNIQKWDGDKLRIGLSDNEISGEIKKYKPSMVGISCIFFFNNIAAHHIAKLCKEVDPAITVIMGGIYPTVFPERALEDKNVDFVVHGEGEIVLSNLIECIEGERDFRKVLGIGFLTRDGEITINQPQPYVENLDELPFPARHLLNIKEYSDLNASFGLSKQQPYTTILSSRGCPLKCTFCTAHNLWSRRIRFRSAENVLKEIEYLVEDCDIRELHFTDENVSLNRTRFASILRGIIERGYHKYVSWTTPNGIGVYTLNEELIDLMAESGCYSLALAIESGDQNTLDNIIKKPIKLKEVVEIVRYIQHKGMKTRGFFIIGFPGEKKQNMMNTINFANFLKLDAVGMNILRPYPATEIFETAKRENYLVKDYDISQLSPLGATIETPQFSRKWLLDIIETDRFLALRRRKPHRIFKLLFEVFTRNKFRAFKILPMILLHALTGDISGKRLKNIHYET